MKPLALLLAGAFVVSAHAAAAQDLHSTRPYRGLFAPPSTSTGQHFEIAWSATATDDGDIIPDAGVAADPTIQLGGEWQRIELAAIYSYQGRHVTVRATASGGDRQYASWKSLSAFDGGGDVSLAADLTRTTKVSVSQAVRYEPFYQLNFVESGALPELPAIAPGDQALVRASSQTLEGVVSLTQKLGRHATAGFDYAYRHTALEGSDTPFFSQTISGRITRTLTRYAALRLGYGYGVTTGLLMAPALLAIGPSVAPASPLTMPVPRLINHNIDVGIAYARPLSHARTTFTFLTGVTGLNGGSTGPSTSGLLLDASVAHELGRTWLTNLGFHRGVTFIEGIAGPAYADAVQHRIGGFVSRRVDIGATTGYSTGQIGQTHTAGYVTYSQGADLRFALSRNLALVAAYDYYHYDFDAGVVLPPGISRSLDRQSVRVGVSGWLPLVR